ncbi:lipid II flippase MurJ [Nonomuraea jiangxiensis]|uniref:Putative peptidoglycan lipid II flippase n=1 Tax=Nonomuraea jiangxiensis TaxID=633440 RepID=A0A1G9P7A2_9ACTN|nr:lipid II flippase MurJ [Nonomuraea jiangxiensis]SDL94619.1 putative peptidoglycan lipid II flippase [Nonomuraea jiangxiensis]
MTTATSPAARAVSVTALLIGLGSLLGFARDLLVGTVFGADAGTDAFLVAWTIPETAAPLLIEGAMAFVLVPLFSRAVEAGDDVRGLVSSTLPRLCLGLAGLGALVAVGAPYLVGLLAPGIPQAGLAADCMRVAAVTIPLFGLAGYLSAVLRVHQAFAPPAAIYVAYNVGIVACVWTLRDRGVYAAALGVAAGALGMVLVQTPAFLRRIGPPRRPARGVPLPLAAFLPVAVFTLVRQCQVFVERFVGSSLPEGSISHLNYAQKIAQVPMVLSLIVATVSFPQLARSIAAGDTGRARRRMAGDLAVACAVVLAGTAAFLACAPDIVAVLLEHGAFTEADTAATAHIMRVYALGLLGQAVVGVACRAYFCGARASWYPALAMAAGLIVTAVLARPAWGVTGIAAANAAGITLTAVLLLTGLRSRVMALPFRMAVAPLRGLLPAAAAATAAGWGARSLLADLPRPIALALAGAALAATFCAVAAVSGTALIGTTPITRLIRMRGRA